MKQAAMKSAKRGRKPCGGMAVCIPRNRADRIGARLIQVKVIYREWLRTGSGTKLVSQRTGYELHLVDAHGNRVYRLAEEV